LTGRPFVLEETNWGTVKSTDYQVAILPWGATEAHNFHLPYGTDNYESKWVAEESARRAWDKGAKVTVLPTIPFGVNTGQLDIRLCINMNPGTQAVVLGDIVQSLEAQGIPKLVIINSHGGNDFRQMIRELQAKSRLLIASINWWTSADASKYFDEPGDHAGELETSVMMEIAPGLGITVEGAGRGHARKFRIAGLRDGLAWTPRAWTSVTDDTGVGDPSRATREKGKAFLDVVTDRISSFLVELSDADTGRMYE
jgi:creatinine amidohydrolase